MTEGAKSMSTRPTGPFRDEQAAQIEFLMKENEQLTEDNSKLTQLVTRLKANRPSRFRMFYLKWEWQLDRAIVTVFLTAVLGGLLAFMLLMVGWQSTWSAMRKRALSNCLEMRDQPGCLIEDRILYDQQCCDVEELFAKRVQLDECLQHHSAAVCMRFVD